MKTWFIENWTPWLAVVLLGAAGMFAYGRFTPGCSYASTSQPVNPTRPTEGDATSTDTQASVVYADEVTFDEEVLRSDVPVLVDFYADWCGPCRALGPVLEALAQETPHAKIVKVDVDASPQLARRYRVSSIPNLLVFRDGQVVGQQVGPAGKRQLKALLAK